MTMIEVPLKNSFACRVALILIVKMDFHCDRRNDARNSITTQAIKCDYFGGTTLTTSKIIPNGILLVDV